MKDLNFQEMAQIADPRRASAIVYADDECRDNLAALVVWDCEIWAIHARAKEPMMAQFRLQFWADKVKEGKEIIPFDDVSICLKQLLQNGRIAVDDIMQYLDKHIDFLQSGNGKSSRQAIWEVYFRLALKIVGADCQLSRIAANIIINAIDDNYADNIALFKEVNNHISSLNNEGRNQIMNALLFACLAHKKQNFENIITNKDNKRKLGLSALISLFYHRLTGRL